jgi:hypothetical protein
MRGEVHLVRLDHNAMVAGIFLPDTTHGAPPA